MPVDRSKFLALCKAVTDADQIDLSEADREVLVVLLGGLNNLKADAERALQSVPMAEHQPN